MKTNSLEDALAALELEMGGVPTEEGSIKESANGSAVIEGEVTTDDLGEELEALEGEVITDDLEKELEALEVEVVTDDLEKELEALEGEVVTDDLGEELEALESLEQRDPVHNELDELDELLAELGTEEPTSKAKKLPSKEEQKVDRLKAIKESAGAFSDADSDDRAPSVDKKAPGAKEPSSPAKKEPRVVKEPRSAVPREPTEAYEVLTKRLSGIKVGEMTVVIAKEVFSDASSKSAADLESSFKELINGMAKKVGEKAVNIFAHLQGHASLSVYTKMAIDLLIEKGDMSSANLVQCYLDRPYSIGTARAQAGQMMQLFTSLGLARRVSRDTIQLNEESELLKMYKAAA